MLAGMVAGATMAANKNKAPPPDHLNKLLLGPLKPEEPKQLSLRKRFQAAVKVQVYNMAMLNNEGNDFDSILLYTDAILLVPEKGFKFHAQPQTGAYSC